MNNFVKYILERIGLKTVVIRIFTILKKGKLLLSLWCKKTGIRILYYKNTYFNAIVKAQIRDVKSIPIIIISFNQLYYLKKLIDFLIDHQYKNIIIIDNNSTYKPLLEYFEKIEDAIKIHRLSKNIGHTVLWENKELFKLYTKGYFVVTDPDIVPNKDCPADFLMYFKKILDRNYGITKVGFSLRLDNLPETNMNKESILQWESQFWENKMNDGNYLARIDTTFALYRPRFKYNKPMHEPACRTKIPYQAIHGGWYINSERLTEEQQFFFDNCHESSSWRIDEKGSLKNAYYLN